MKVKRSHMWVLLGLILAILGYGFIQMSETAYSSLAYPLIARSENEWETDGDFNVGDVMFVVIRQGANPPWSLVLEADPPRTKYVYLNISDPKGGGVLFELEYFLPEESSPGDPLRSTYVRVVKNDSDCLLIDLNQAEFKGEFVAGRVNFSGTYKAKVVYFDPPAGNESPPSLLEFRKIIMNTAKPYSFMVYLGSLVVPLGFLIAAWGAFTLFKARRVRRVKSTKSFLKSIRKF
jgi:hypothetical protein